MRRCILRYGEQTETRMKENATTSQKNFIS